MFSPQSPTLQPFNPEQALASASLHFPYYARLSTQPSKPSNPPPPVFPEAPARKRLPGGAQFPSLPLLRRLNVSMLTAISESARALLTAISESARALTRILSLLPLSLSLSLSLSLALSSLDPGLQCVCVASHYSQQPRTLPPPAEGRTRTARVTKGV